MMPYEEQTNDMPYTATDLPSSPQIADDAKSSDNECAGDEANKHSSTNFEDASFFLVISYAQNAYACI